MTARELYCFGKLFYAKTKRFVFKTKQFNFVNTLCGRELIKTSLNQFRREPKQSG